MVALECIHVGVEVARTHPILPRNRKARLIPSHQQLVVQSFVEFAEFSGAPRDGQSRLQDGSLGRFPSVKVVTAAPENDFDTTKGNVIRFEDFALPGRIKKRPSKICTLSQAHFHAALLPVAAGLPFRLSAR